MVAAAVAEFAVAGASWTAVPAKEQPLWWLNFAIIGWYYEMKVQLHETKKKFQSRWDMVNKFDWIPREIFFF